MYTTTENALHLFQMSGNDKWKLAYQANQKKGSVIFEYPSDEDTEVSQEAAYERLEDVMSNLSDGKYHLKHFKHENNNTRGYKEVYFQIGETATRGSRNVAGIGSTPGNFNLIGSLGGIEKIFDERLELALLKKEKEELEYQLEEYQRNESDPSGAKGLIGMITDGIGSIPNGKEIISHAFVNLMSRFLSPGVAGPGVMAETQPQPEPQAKQPEPQPEPTKPKENMTPTFFNENIDRIENVMMRLGKLDPTILDTLEKMADKGEKNPSLIGMLKNFL